MHRRLSRRDRAVDSLRLPMPSGCPAGRGHIAGGGRPMNYRPMALLALIIGVFALTAAILASRGDTPTPAATTVTPGVVLTTSAADVCTPGWASKHRHGLTATQKATVLRAYGYLADQKVAEYDHLISLELGGGNTERNIWPQVDPAQDQRKDRLENTLHAQVCAGRMQLAAAQ